MADEKNGNSVPEFTPGAAAKAVISLSQAVLAPLDAIFKAQTHAARSFINMVLQLGFPYHPLDSEGNPKKLSPEEERKLQTVRTQVFYQENIVDGKSVRQKISIPALALVPITPLAVEAAEFSFEMAVSHIAKHAQQQASEENKVEEEYDKKERPWFLVRDPVSIRGVIAPKRQSSEENATQAKIQITIKVGPTKMPAGMDKLLTALTQAGSASLEK